MRPQAERDVYPGIAVPSANLEHQDPRVSSDQPVGEGTTGGAGTHDNEIVLVGIRGRHDGPLR